MRVTTILFGLIFSLSPTANASDANTTRWSGAIEKVSKLSGQYFNYALEMGSGYPGSSMHGIGYPKNFCGIIGRMLGMHEHITVAEFLDHPPMLPSTDPQDLLLHSMVLDSWVAAARNALKMTESQRIQSWNLECIGEHGISKTAYIDGVTAADFVVDDGRIIAYGEIDAKFAASLVAILDANPLIDTIMLGSGGGNVANAIIAGREIRRRGISTALYGPCYSACPLVFAGGKDRHIWMREGPALGFHQVYTGDGMVEPFDSVVYAVIVSYLMDMGVDPGMVLTWMYAAPPAEMNKPDYDDLCRSRIATWIQHVC